jgi:hypothetical protein
MLNADDLWVAIVPEAFTNPGLISELSPTLLRIDQLDQSLPFRLGVPRSELTHDATHRTLEVLIYIPNGIYTILSIEK